MKSSGVGGQAVIEGVMMKNQDEYAVAVRKPNKEIIVEKNSYVSKTKKYPILGLPIVRGIVNFAESMVIGTKTLTFSSSFFEEEEEKDISASKKTKPSKGKADGAAEEKSIEKSNEKSDAIVMALTVCASIVLAIGIFMLLPFFLGNLLSSYIESDSILALIEGLIRITIFIGYVLIISQLNDIKRVFMYHGAEHKTINCIENGFELTVENVKWQSKQHKRCGTSFMLIVMVISIIFFIFIRVDSVWMRAVFRVLLVPIIAGVSYEFIRLAGRSDSKVVTILSKPGLWLQGLTTREPDDEMIEVAILSVEAVFDWKAYQVENKIQPKRQRKARKVVEEEQVNEVKSVSPTLNTEQEEEEDEILRALDRYFTCNEDEQKNNSFAATKESSNED